MLTRDEINLVQVNTRLWDLITDAWIYACTCENGGRRHVSYVRNNPKEFTFTKPSNQQQQIGGLQL